MTQRTQSTRTRRKSRPQNTSRTQWVLAAGSHIGGAAGNVGTKTFRRYVTSQLGGAEKSAEAGKPDSSSESHGALASQDVVAVVVPTRFGARRSRMVTRVIRAQLAAQSPSGASSIPGIAATKMPTIRVFTLADRVAALEPPTAPASYLVEVETDCVTITALDATDGQHISRLFFDLPRSLLTTPEGINELLRRINLLAEDLDAPGTSDAEIIVYGELSPCTALVSSLHRRKILAFVLEDRTVTDRKYPLIDDNDRDDDLDDSLGDELDSELSGELEGEHETSAAGASYESGLTVRTVNVEPTVLRPRPEDMKKTVDIGQLVESWWPVALIGVIVLLIGGGLMTLLRPSPAGPGTEAISAAATPGTTFEVPSSDSNDANNGNNGNSASTNSGSASTSTPSTAPTTSPKRRTSSQITGAGLAISFPPGWNRDDRITDKLVVVSDNDLPMRVMGLLQPVHDGVDHEGLVGELERLVDGQVTLSELRPEVTVGRVMVATYREQPDDRSEVLWHIRLVGDQQLSIGCQYRGRLTTELRAVCEEAVASAEPKRQ